MPRHASTEYLSVDSLRVLIDESERQKVDLELKRHSPRVGRKRLASIRARIMRCDARIALLSRRLESAARSASVTSGPMKDVHLIDEKGRPLTVRADATAFNRWLPPLASLAVIEPFMRTRRVVAFADVSEACVHAVVLPKARPPSIHKVRRFYAAQQRRFARACEKMLAASPKKFQKFRVIKQARPGDTRDRAVADLRTRTPALVTLDFHAKSSDAAVVGLFRMVAPSKSSVGHFMRRCAKLTPRPTHFVLGYCFGAATPLLAKRFNVIFALCSRGVFRRVVKRA
jgi:hypothetical protein